MSKNDEKLDDKDLFEEYEYYRKEWVKFIEGLNDDLMKE